MANEKVYKVVEENLIKLIEAGADNWVKPWEDQSFDGTKNFVSGKLYRGINALTTGIAASIYGCPYFITMKQLKAKGGKLDGKQSYLPVVFWKWIKIEEKDEAGNKTGEEKKIPFARFYQVYNLAQTTLTWEKPTEEAPKFTPIQRAEKLAKLFKDSPEVKHAEQRAYYSPTSDYINMPKKETFKSSEEYYSTLYHEMAHSTGHKNRLNRKEVVEANFFGSDDYSKEELTAEFTAAFLCGKAGIEKTFKNSAAYLASWCKKLAAEKTGQLVTAAQRAQKAADYIQGIKAEEK